MTTAKSPAKPREKKKPETAKRQRANVPSQREARKGQATAQNSGVTVGETRHRADGNSALLGAGSRLPQSELAREVQGDPLQQNLTAGETAPHSTKTVDQIVNDRYAIYQGDCCDLIKGLPDTIVDFGIHSPPFEGLYKFSNYDRDISNNDGPEFWEHYGFLISELYRVTKAGRLHSVHCMQLPTSKNRDGFIGMRDFRGEIIRAYQAAGWIFHSEVCVWKDPVVAQQRTKSLRLLHKQIVKDSTLSGMGLADYIVTFRKPGVNLMPVDGMFDRFIGEGLDISQDGYAEYCRKGRLEDPQFKPWPMEMWRSVLVWQRYASPVWTDIRQTRTLQYRGGRDHQDEQHISPLQLDVIERCLELWSAPGETILTPFLGIGSEVYCSVDMGRKGIGFELKPSYFRQSVRNLAELDKPPENRLFEDEADVVEAEDA